MKDEKKLVKVTDESVGIRIDINENYHPVMSKLRKLFNLSTFKKPKFFKILNDFVYYKGGYPRPDSPPKLNDFLDIFGNIFQLYKFLGNESEINQILEDNYGIKVSVVSSSDLDEPLEIMKLKKFQKLWSQVFDEEYDGQSKKEIIEKLVDRGQDLQSTICKLADQIKIDNAKEVEEKCEVKKSIFIPIVNLKSNYVRSGNDDVFEKIKKINDDNQVFNDVVNKVIGEAQ
jgi:hypothetical protein